MKPITIHPGSVLVGAGLLGLAIFATGASQSAATTLGIFTGPEKPPARVEVTNLSDLPGHPHPRDIIVIEAGFPYVVPTGKLFVLTAFGSSGGRTSPVTLKVNGTTVFGLYDGSGPYLSIHHIPPHYTVAPGAVITTAGRAWGYLVDE